MRMILLDKTPLDSYVACENELVMNVPSTSLPSLKPGASLNSNSISNTYKSQNYHRADLE